MAGAGATAIAAFWTGPGRAVAPAALEAAAIFCITWIVLAPRTTECDLPSLMDAIGSATLLILAFALTCAIAGRVLGEGGQVFSGDVTYRQPALVSLAIAAISAGFFGRSSTPKGSRLGRLIHFALFLPACCALGASVAFSLSLVLSRSPADFDLSADAWFGGTLGLFTVPIIYRLVPSGPRSAGLGSCVAIGILLAEVLCAEIAGVGAGVAAVGAICLGGGIVLLSRLAGQTAVRQ